MAGRAGFAHPACCLADGTPLSSSQDKHQTASEEDRAAAEKKFQEIQKAYDSLMSTDEEATIEALKAH